MVERYWIDAGPGGAVMNRASTAWGYRVLRRVSVPRRRVNWLAVAAWVCAVAAWWIYTGRGVDALLIAGGAR